MKAWKCAETQAAVVLGGKRLGMKTRVMEEIGKRIEEFLRANAGATEKQIKKAVSGSTQAKEKVLRRLVEQGKVLRQPKPGRGGGFLYRLAAPPQETPVQVEPSPRTETSPEFTERAKVAEPIAEAKEAPPEEREACPVRFQGRCTVLTRRQDGQVLCPYCFPEPTYPAWGRL